MPTAGEYRKKNESNEQPPQRLLIVYGICESTVVFVETPKLMELIDHNESSSFELMVNSAKTKGTSGRKGVWVFEAYFEDDGPLKPWHRVHGKFREPTTEELAALFTGEHPWPGGESATPAEEE